MLKGQLNWVLTLTNFLRRVTQCQFQSHCYQVQLRGSFLRAAPKENNTNRNNNKYNEAFWYQEKDKIKAIMGPSNHEMIQDYLLEFIWTQHLREYCFFHFWNEIASTALKTV